MNRFTVAIAATIAAATVQPAAAQTTLTFEGQSNTTYGAPIERGGFVIGNPVGQEQHFHEIDSTQFGLASNGTGVLLNDRDTQIFLTAVGGGSFTLTSFDIAASFQNNPGTSFTVTGFLGASTVGSVGGALGQFATFNGFAGSVDRLVFDGIGADGGFELDNVVLNGVRGGGVPEPATWALMILGMGAVGGAMRRRAAVSARVAIA